MADFSVSANGRLIRLSNKAKKEPEKSMSTAETGRLLNQKEIHEIFAKQCTEE